MSDSYRVLVIIDDKPTQAVLVDLPTGIAEIDTYIRLRGVLGPHKIDLELRRIT